MTDHQFSAARSPLSPTTPEAGVESHAPALKFDASVYRHFLEESGWTEAQKDEFTEALWLFMVNCVDFGFNLHPLQQVINCSETLELESPPVVFSDDISNTTNEQAVEPSDIEATERNDS